MCFYVCKNSCLGTSSPTRRRHEPLTKGSFDVRHYQNNDRPGRTETEIFLKVWGHNNNNQSVSDDVHGYSFVRSCDSSQCSIRAELGNANCRLRIGLYGLHNAGEPETGWGYGFTSLIGRETFRVV